MRLEWCVELRVASSSLGVREVCDGGLKGCAGASWGCEEVFVVGGAVADLVYSYNPIVGVVSKRSLRPLYGWTESIKRVRGCGRSCAPISPG